MTDSGWGTGSAGNKTRDGQGPQQTKELPQPEGVSADQTHLLYGFHKCLSEAQAPASGVLEGGGNFEGGSATKKEVRLKECALEGTRKQSFPILLCFSDTMRKSGFLGHMQLSCMF